MNQPPHTLVGTSRSGLVTAPTQGRARWWRELVIAVVFYATYDAIRGVISGSTSDAERHGWDLLHWEKILHLDPERWLNANLQHVAWLAVPACFFYAALHFVVTPAVLVWTFHRRPGDYRRARTVLGIVTAAALVGFWWFPTAPPRLLAGAGFHDTLAAFSNWGWWGHESSVPAGAAALANEYAAMPSLHVAWALWCGAVVARNVTRRAVKIVALAYPVLTTLVVLGTANHYLFDVLAGLVIWLVATGIARWLAITGPPNGPYPA